MGRDTVEVTSLALRGGAKIIQYRNKKEDKTKILETCKNISKICKKYDAIFIVNDYSEIAISSNADGVHVGQKDESIQSIREKYNNELIIGTSNANLGEIKNSHKNKADYIAIGSIYPTETKIDTRPAGIETLISARKLISSPIVAIGGINLSNSSQVIEAGADSICVATAITKAKDPEKASKLLSKKFIK